LAALHRIDAQLPSNFVRHESTCKVQRLIITLRTHSAKESITAGATSKKGNNLVPNAFK
jgi:hypothetical protein